MGRKFWSVPQRLSSRNVEDSPDCIVAHAEEKNEVIPFGEYGARSLVNRNLPRHKVCPWMVVEGRGNNRGEGLGIGHVLGEMDAWLDTGVKGVLATMRRSLVVRPRIEMYPRRMALRRVELEGEPSERET